MRPKSHDLFADIPSFCEVCDLAGEPILIGLDLISEFGYRLAEPIAFGEETGWRPLLAELEGGSHRAQPPLQVFGESTPLLLSHRGRSTDRLAVDALCSFGLYLRAPLDDPLEDIVEPSDR